MFIASLSEVSLTIPSESISITLRGSMILNTNNVKYIFYPRNRY